MKVLEMVIFRCKTYCKCLGANLQSRRLGSPMNETLTNAVFILEIGGKKTYEMLTDRLQ